MKILFTYTHFRMRDANMGDATMRLYTDCIFF